LTKNLTLLYQISYLYINKQQKLKAMKTLTKKSEITARLLNKDCDYKGHRIGKEGKYYFRGSHFHSGVEYFSSLKELKESL